MAEVTQGKDTLYLHVGLSKGQRLAEGQAGTESWGKSIFQGGAVSVGSCWALGPCGLSKQGVPTGTWLWMRVA